MIRTDWFGARVCRLQYVRAHKDADRLEVAILPGNITAVVPKGEFQKGDIVLAVGAESVIPDETPICGMTGRVKRVTIRGEVSCALVTKNMPVIPGLNQPGWVTYIGESIQSIDVTEALGITRWVHPADRDYVNGYGHDRTTAYDCDAPWMPKFSKPIAHYKVELDEVFQSGEQVYVTEKLHGTNARYALGPDGKLVCASKNVVLETGKGGVWERLGLANDLEAKLKRCDRRIVLYGEIVGPGIQDLHYGLTEPRFVLFDVREVGGEYYPHAVLPMFGAQFGLDTVPNLFSGQYVPELIDLAEGNTVYGRGVHLREGIVIRPFSPKRFSDGERAIVKVVSSVYRNRKHAEA